jgi:hypothetical protein
MAQRKELIASLAADSGMENPFLQTPSTKTITTHLTKKKKIQEVVIEGVEEVEEEEKKRKEATIASTNASVIAVLSEKLQYVQSLQRRGPSAKDLQLLSQSLDPAEIARWEEDRKEKRQQARNKSIKALSTYVFSEYKRVKDTLPAAMSSSSTSANSASASSYYSPLSPPQVEIEVRLGQLSSDSSQFISGVHESTFDALKFALEQQMAATSTSTDPLKVFVRRSTDQIKTLKTHNEDRMVRQKLRISCNSDSSAPQGRGNRWLTEDEHDKKKGKGKKKVNAKGKGHGKKLQDIESESERESESEQEEEEKKEPTAALKNLWSLRNVPLTTCNLSFDCRLTVSTEQDVVLPVTSSSSSPSFTPSTSPSASTSSSDYQRYKRRWSFSKKSEDVLLDLTIVASQKEGGHRSHTQQTTVPNTQFSYEVEMEVKPESLSKFSTLEGSRHVISQMFDKMQELNECLKFTRTLPGFSSISLAASLTSAKQARVAALFKSLIAGEMTKLNEDDDKSFPTGLPSPCSSALPFGRRHFAKITKEKRDRVWVCEQSSLVESNKNAGSHIPAVIYYLLAVPFEASKKKEESYSSDSQNRPPTSSISIIDPFDDIGGLYLIDPVRLSIFSVKGMDSVVGALASSGPTILEGDLIQGRGDQHTVVPPPIFQIFDIIVSDGFTGISEENFEVRLKEIRALVDRYSELPGLNSRSQPFLIASKAFYPITDFSLMCSNHLFLDSKSVFWFIRRGGTDAREGGGVGELEGRDPISVPFLKVASSHRLDGFLFVFSTYQRRRSGGRSTANTALLSYNFTDRTVLNLRASQHATGTKKIRLSCVTLDPLTKKEIEVPVEDMVEFSDSVKKRLGRDLEQLVGAAGKEVREEGKQNRVSPSSKDVEMGKGKEQEEEGEEGEKALSSSSVISGVVRCAYSLWDGAWKYLSLSDGITPPLTSQQTFRTLLAIAEDITVNELIARLTPPPPQAQPRHNRGVSFATPSASSSTSTEASSLSEAFSAALACASSGLSSSSSDSTSGATDRKRNRKSSGRKDNNKEKNMVLKRQKQAQGASSTRR